MNSNWIITLFDWCENFLMNVATAIGTTYEVLNVCILFGNQSGVNVCLEKPPGIKCCKRVQVSNLKLRSTRRNYKGKETILFQLYSSVRLNFK